MNVLDEHELKSAVWQKLQAQMEGRITVLQRELEGDLDPTKTAKVRGRIAELRKRLAIGAEACISNLTRTDY